MSRKISNLGELAEQVLAKVESTQLEKTAQVAYTKKASMSTEVGGLVEKVAASLRLVNIDDITYDDLQNFRKNHDV